MLCYIKSIYGFLSWYKIEVIIQKVMWLFESFTFTRSQTFNKDSQLLSFSSQKIQ